jgi:tetratricopeptide (TPR) repeat protein
MESKTLPTGTATKNSLRNDRGGLLFICLIVLVVAVTAFFGWGSSAFSGRMTSRDHAQKQAKEELDRRFREGVVMLHAKQYEHALTAFHRVLQLNPEMPEAHVNAGYALLGMKNYKVAADFFDEATTLRPNQLNAYFGLGEALKEMGDSRGALQAMETYLHRSPESDPFRRKAESAIWELRAELETEGPPPRGDVPHRRGKGVEGKQ